MPGATERARTLAGLLDKPAPRRQQRRRRTPEEAVQEILAAAHRFLENRPYREMTVETLMAGSVLARSSFYVYFSNREEVIRRLIAGIAEEVSEFAERWLVGVSGQQDIGAALAGVANLYRGHGRVLRALADASATDSEMEAIHAELIHMLVAATEQGIVREQERGASVVADPRQVARLLVTMTERIANDTWGRDADPESRGTLEALVHVWSWSIYGQPPALDEAQ